MNTAVKFVSIVDYIILFYKINQRLTYYWNQSITNHQLNNSNKILLYQSIQ